MATTTKRCPGFEGIDQPAHDLPADVANFNSNAGSKDGLSTRCRVCGNAYGKAWAARDRTAKKGRDVSDMPVGVFAPGKAMAPGGAALAALDTLDAGGTADEALTEAIATGLEGLLAKYRGEPGWSVEVVAGVEYPLPDGKEAGTPDGQAALAAVNAAQAAERRRRDAERKRNERAAAKAKAATTA